MSFNYDPTLPTFKDRVRFFSGDTVQIADSSNDEEITALENYEPNLFLAASHVSENIGMKIAQRAVLIDTAANVQGGIRIDRRLQPKWWFARSASLKDRATNPMMNADEIIQSFDFDIDVYGLDWSDYGDGTGSNLVHENDFLWFVNG